MPAPIVGAAAAAAARLVAKKLATKTAKKAVTSSARVRKNTNAVAKVIKTESPTTQKTRIIQKNSVKKIGTSKPANNINTLMADAKKTVKSSPVKVVAKKAFKPKQRTNGLSDKAQRGIDKERLNRPSRFDWR
jgi:hypothetical protein